MTITLTLPMVVFIISLLIGWTAFLLGAIKWLLNRQITGLETRVEVVEKKTDKAAADMTSLRLDFSQKITCANHQRMESNDTEMFKRLDQLHGEFREMLGIIKIVKNHVDLMYQHHLNGGQ